MNSKPKDIKAKGDQVTSIMTTIGWVLFGLSVILIPLWIVFFVYVLLFIIVIAIFFLIREFLKKSMKKTGGDNNSGKDNSP